MERRDLILKLIVEHFIKTAQPVGSQTLLDEYRLDCSSATIRNEMNALERDGYIEKPHTSSGRVPSKQGYVYYVEHLRDDRIDTSVKYALESVLDKQAQSVIPLSSNTATAVFVTDQGYVENKTFILQEGISIDDVKKTVEGLNDRLRGTAISDIVPKMEAMRPALTDYLVGKDAIYQAFFAAFAKFASERMNLYGKANLLEQPEYKADATKLRKLLGLLESPAELRTALSESSEAGEGDLHLKIGSDESGLDDVALITAKVQIPGGQSASISLVGPKRMDYDKAMGLLSYVSERLDEYFAGGKGEKKQ